MADQYWPYDSCPVETRQEARAAFHERFRRLIQLRGISQADAARAVFGANEDGTAKGADRVSRYVSGKSVPSLRNVRVLENAFGLPTDTLMPPVNSLPTEHIPDGYRRLEISAVVPNPVADEVETLVGAFA